MAMLKAARQAPRRQQAPRKAAPGRFGFMTIRVARPHPSRSSPPGPESSGRGSHGACQGVPAAVGRVGPGPARRQGLIEFPKNGTWEPAVAHFRLPPRRAVLTCHYDVRPLPPDQGPFAG
jgi:hypothetical protein